MDKDGISIKFSQISERGKCDICKKKKKVVNLNSIFGNLTFNTCKDCLEKRLEPYPIMIGEIAIQKIYTTDELPYDLKTQAIRIAELNGKNEEEFDADVNELIELIKNSEKESER